MRFIFDKVTRYLRDINFSSFLMFLVFFNEKRFLIFFDLWLSDLSWNMQSEEEEQQKYRKEKEN